MTSDRLTLPNLLSAYRIVSAPLVIWTIATGRREWFFGLIAANLITDACDGALARATGRQSVLGARLDSWGDLVTYGLALAGAAVFEPFIFQHRRPAVALLIGSFLVPQILSLIRFRTLISLHLYSSKATAWVQGMFFCSYLFVGYVPTAFYTLLAISILNNIEEFLVLLALRENRTDARGLYWVLKESRASTAKRGIAPP